MHTVVQLLSSSDFFSHFRICRIRESLLRVGAFSNAQQPGEGWLPGDRLRQGPLGLLLMRLGEGIGKGLINQAGGLLGTRKRESGWRVLLSESWGRGRYTIVARVSLPTRLDARL